MRAGSPNAPASSTQALIENIIHDSRYQRELPGGTEFGSEESNGGGSRFGSPRGQVRPINPAAHWAAIRWILTAVAGIALVAIAGGTWGSRNQTLSPMRTSAPVANATSQAPLELPSGALSEAERLAAAGQPEHAVRELLLAMFEAIRRADRLADRACALPGARQCVQRAR